MSIQENISEVVQRIEAARARSVHAAKKVKLLAVSKKVEEERLVEAIKAGVRYVGENYIQEAKQKLSNLLSADFEVEFHFIGHLQRNKVSLAVRLFDLIQTVDRAELALEISKAAEREEKQQDVLVQVNISEESTKSGVLPGKVLELCKYIQKLPQVNLCGLMCIGTYHPREAEEELRREEFIAMRELRARVQTQGKIRLPELSMGMSHDYELAVEEGATIVRLGTSIFGPRAR